jgi:FHS family L-fucose permease-like MFS transporter
MVGIFFYVGVEIALAANAIKFFLAQGVDQEVAVSQFVASHEWLGGYLSLKLASLTATNVAGILASFYMFAIMIGRFAGTWAMKAVKAEKLLAGLGFFGVALMLVAMGTTGSIAVWSLIFCGLANSIMYPTIFALGIAELGPLTSKGSGVITIGNVGGAVIPPLFGALAVAIGYQHAFILPIICYLYVAYYGLSGYKPTRAV